MIEILPIKIIRDEDGPIFGKEVLNMAKLGQLGLPVADGIVISPPELHLKTILEHHDFGNREIFEQSLTLVKKEIESTPVPEILEKETKGKKLFLGTQASPGVAKNVKQLWLQLLDIWLEEIKTRLWNIGFHKGISENLDPQIVIFTKKLEAFGDAFFDQTLDEVVVHTSQGSPHPNDLIKIEELVAAANKKLLIPNKYQWIIDKGVKISGILPYTPINTHLPGADMVETALHLEGGIGTQASPGVAKSTVKIFLDFSKGLVVEREVDPDLIGVDGVYISTEKIFDLNEQSSFASQSNPQNSFEELVFKLVESANTFAEKPVLVKLADMSEGMGKVRGTLRLLHQDSLLGPLVEALDFTRHKKGLTNVHIVIPFVRGTEELLKIKRELAAKKLMRKNSLQIWMEVATPENIINLEDYLMVGVDGIVLNLDELTSHLNGFDYQEQEMMIYKNEVSGLLKFLEDGIKLLHKSKIPFISYGSVSLNQEVLEFLIEKGVYGIVVERYETHSIVDLLKQVEKRMILRRSS